MNKLVEIHSNMWLDPYIIKGVSVAQNGIAYYVEVHTTDMLYTAFSSTDKTKAVEVAKSIVSKVNAPMEDY